MWSWFEYDILASAEADENDEAFDHQQHASRKKQSRHRNFSFALALGMIASSILSFLAGTKYRSPSQYPVSSHAGFFETDFGPARGLVRLEQRRFSGTARFHPNGTMYRVANRNEPQYFGKPSAEIEMAWEALIGGRYFYISDEEAEQTWGTSYKQYYRHPEYGYEAGLDVLHQLHCVVKYPCAEFATLRIFGPVRIADCYFAQNKIRKALYPEYYPPEDSSVRTYHLEHCLEIVRQTIQCAGDLTPIPMRWFDAIPGRFTDSDQIHTCRNFERIRNWATERYNGSLAVFKKPH